MRRIPWTRQPPYPVGLSGPFSGNGSLALIGDYCLCAASNVLPRTSVATISRKLVEDGIAGAGENLSACVYFPAGQYKYAQPKHTVVLAHLTWSGDTSISKALAGFGYNGSPNAYVEEMFSVNINQNGSVSNGNFRVSFRDSAGGRLDMSPTTFRLTAGVQARIVVALDSGSTGRIWVNSKQVAVSYGSTGYSPSTTNVITKEYTIFNFNYGSSTSGHSDAINGYPAMFAASLFARLVVPVAWAPLLAQNPWQIFEPYTVFDNTPIQIVAAQFLRPISDISNSGWTPSSGSDLFPMIGETTRNDATYISAVEAGAWCEVLLGTSTGDPLSSINHLPRIVMSAGSGGIIIRLKQGATLIKEWTYSSLTGTDTLYEPTLTGGEIDSITDYTDLRLYLETTA